MKLTAVQNLLEAEKFYLIKYLFFYTHTWILKVTKFIINKHDKTRVVIDPLGHPTVRPVVKIYFALLYFESWNGRADVRTDGRHVWIYLWLSTVIMGRTRGSNNIFQSWHCVAPSNLPAASIPGCNHQSFEFCQTTQGWLGQIQSKEKWQ